MTTETAPSGVSTPEFDVSELLQWFSTPRPNGSAAKRQVYAHILDWLTQHGIAYEQHTFRLYPLFWQGIGVWLILSRTLLALAVWMAWGWWTLLIALIGLMGGVLDVAANLPVASWFWPTEGKNLIVRLGPRHPQREIILSAHYDTKTELLDHRQRMFFVRNLPVGIVLTVLLGLIGPFQQAAVGTPLADALGWVGLALAAPMLILAYGLGANLILGFLRPASEGAVDNGAACIILLGLAQQYTRQEDRLGRTRLTLAIFDGEEINMQGSQAYVRDRLRNAPSKPGSGPFERTTMAVNLEVMAQDGEYVIWESDGISLKLWPNSEPVIQAVAQAVEQETGEAPLRVGPINSDGGSFLRGGVSAATLGTYDRLWRDRGFHSLADNRRRVVLERIPEAMRILTRLIQDYDQGN